MSYSFQTFYGVMPRLRSKWARSRLTYQINHQSVHSDYREHRTGTIDIVYLGKYPTVAFAHYGPNGKGSVINLKYIDGVLVSYDPSVKVISTDEELTAARLSGASYIWIKGFDIRPTGNRHLAKRMGLPRQHFSRIEDHFDVEVETYTRPDQ